MKIEENIQWKIGRSNLALTVFVPWDCNNKCPFCTSKALYDKIGDGVHIDNKMEIIKSHIQRVLGDHNINEIVFTGGEPMNDTQRLQELIDVVPDGKKIFINTSLPCERCQSGLNYISIKTLRFFEKNKKRITCLNVSRHGLDGNSVYLKNIFDNDLLHKLPVPIRINVVLPDTIPSVELFQLFEYWLKIKKTFTKTLQKKFSISLRADYRHITLDNLKTPLHPQYMEIINANHVNYLGSSGCFVCNDDAFTFKDELFVHFHRGIERSSLDIGKIRTINDILIYPNGSIHYDWDDTKFVMTSSALQELSKSIHIVTRKAVSKRISIPAQLKSDNSKNSSRKSSWNFSDCGRFRNNCGQSGNNYC